MKLEGGIGVGMFGWKCNCTCVRIEQIQSVHTLTDKKEIQFLIYKEILSGACSCNVIYEERLPNI